MKTVKTINKRPNLRDRCVELYGEEFGELYDNLNRGIAIGDGFKTAVVLHLIELAKKGTKT